MYKYKCKNYDKSQNYNRAHELITKRKENVKFANTKIEKLKKKTENRKLEKEN